MKPVIFAAAVFCAVCFISCRERSSTRPTTLANPQFRLPTGSPANQGTVTQAQPSNNGIVPVASNQALNPAHGQPGHRCDIAVGAPLPAGSQVANATTAANAISPAVKPLTTTPVASTTTAPGMNPAHGQPGHRCDIAVGAPLNSKPAATSTPTATTTVAKPAALPPDTMFAKGLNPAHGQPGHRCDVAVGKPLNEAKKKDAATPLMLQPKKTDSILPPLLQATQKGAN